MSAALADALRQLALSPGETYRAAIGGYRVEVRRMSPADTDGGMIDPWFAVPDPPPRRTLTVRRGPADLPRLVALDETDFVPG
ncbi:MAG: hypothetical protein U0746_03660 [Gemmataceae bacterium]